MFVDIGTTQETSSLLISWKFAGGRLFVLFTRSQDNIREVWLKLNQKAEVNKHSHTLQDGNKHGI